MILESRRKRIIREPESARTALHTLSVSTSHSAQLTALISSPAPLQTNLGNMSNIRGKWLLCYRDGIRELSCPVIRQQKVFVRGVGRECASITRGWHPGAPRTFPGLCWERDRSTPISKIQLHGYPVGLGFFPPSFPPRSDFVIGSLYPARFGTALKGREGEGAGRS